MAKPKEPRGPTVPSTEPRDKVQWRMRLLADRRAMPARLRAAEARRIATGLVAAVDTVLGPGPASGPVCGYVPLATEPGSLAMLDALRAAGHEVLVPVVPVSRAHPVAGPAPVAGPVLPGAAPKPARPMSWAPYRGADSLVDGPFGLRQPARPDGDPAVLTTAALVLVPALAVDHRGVRLGRGAGWYDRTLPVARPGTPLVAVVRDPEFVVALPAEAHDVLMTGVLTPRGGLRALPIELD